jgi:hypothetical protein
MELLKISRMYLIGNQTFLSQETESLSLLKCQKPVPFENEHLARLIYANVYRGGGIMAFPFSYRFNEGTMEASITRVLLYLLN